MIGRIVGAAAIMGVLAFPRAEAQGVALPPDTLARRWSAVQSLANRSRWDEALAAARPLVRDSTGRAYLARLAVNAGATAYQAGDTDLARSRWELAVENDPGLPLAAADLATLLLARGANDSARAVIARALRTAPTDARLLGIRTATLDTRPALDSAVKSDRRARARYPGAEPLALDLAGLLAAAGDRVGTAALYDTLLHGRGPSEAVYGAAGRFWLDWKQYETAAAIADSGTSRHPRSGVLWQLAGEAQRGRGAWRVAAIAYRRAAGLLAEPAPAELALLDAEAGAGDTAAAVDVLRAMLARGAAREALLAAAARGSQLGAHAAADSVYRALLRSAPNDVTALDAAAALAEQSGDTARAISLYRQATAVDSGGPEAPLGLLRLAHLPGDSARRMLLLAEWRGIAALEGAELSSLAASQAARTPAALGAARPLTDRRLRLDQLVRAVLDTVVFQTSWGPEELVQLQRIHPANPLLERYGARLSARQGNDSLAVARYDVLIRRTPADAGLQRERAAVLAHAGRSVEAREAYGRALELEPEDESAFRSLVRLDESAGVLNDLLAQVQRLRLRLPSSRVIADREIELLQRVGRLEEAATAAHRLEVKP